MKHTIIPRRPFDDNMPNGYLESDHSFVLNNIKTCVYFLEQGNPKAVPELLKVCREILKWAYNEIDREGLNIEFPFYELQQAIALAETE